MAEAEVARVAADAARRWPLAGLTVIHRFGRIEPGGRIVLVATASAHRRAAFEAAEFLMDYLKTRAPFWKREHPREGEGGAWVEAKADDEGAADRWGGSGGGALSQGRSSHVTIMSCRQIRCAGTRRPNTSRSLRPGRTGPAYPS